MRDVSEILEQIADLRRDIADLPRMYLDDMITYDEHMLLKERYTGYIECFEFALGKIDMYGSTCTIL